MCRIIWVLFFISILTSKNCLSNDGSLFKKYKNIKSLDDSLQHELLYELAYLYVTSNPDSSLYFLDQLITKAEKSKDYTYLYKAFRLKGNEYRIKGEFELALDALNVAASYAQKVNNQRYIAIIFSTLGDTYSSVNNHKYSVYYYNKSIKIFKELNDSSTLASVLFNTGGEYERVNMLDTALSYLSESKNIFTLLNNKNGIAYTTGTSGKIYKRQGNLSLAKKNLIQAIEILTEQEDEYFLTFYKCTLANIYHQENDYDSALIFANSSLELALKVGLPPQVRDASLVLSNIYSATKNFNQAFYFQSKYLSLRDSIYNEGVIRDMAELRSKFEVSQRQVEIETANTELKLNQEKRAKQRIIGIGLIVGIVLLIAIAFVLVRNSRSEKEISVLLHEQKEEIESQRDMLSDLNNSKDRFFSIISHDLRGPIGVLGGTTMLIREYLESKDYELVDELTSNIEFTVKNVQSLLDNLFEWTLSQQGQYNYSPENVDLNKLILENVTIFKEMAATKNISLNFNPSTNEEYLSVDKNSVSTILRNLINNALKFTQKGGAVNVLLNRTLQDIRISVKDTGVGIPQGKIKKLFEIEAKKSTWGTAKEKGLGVGLNLVSEFVKLNNAAIQVNSTVNVGSTFTIAFPLGVEPVLNEEIQANA